MCVRAPRCLTTHASPFFRRAPPMRRCDAMALTESINSIVEGNRLAHVNPSTPSSVVCQKSQVRTPILSMRVCVFRASYGTRVRGAPSVLVRRPLSRAHRASAITRHAHSIQCNARARHHRPPDDDDDDDDDDGDDGAPDGMDARR